MLDWFKATDPLGRNGELSRFMTLQLQLHMLEEIDKRNGDAEVDKDLKIVTESRLAAMLMHGDWPVC